jgi:hypothetical protein
VLFRRAAEMVHGVQPRAGDSHASVPAEAVHPDVEPARSDAQPGAVQPEVQADAGKEADAATKP